MKFFIAALAVLALAMAGSAGATEAPTFVINETRTDAEGITTFSMQGPLPQAGCGQTPYVGEIKKTNLAGVELWKWRAYIKVAWCNYKVTSVVYFYQEPINTFWAWEWKGPVSKQVSAMPATYIDVFIKGHFRACIPVPFLPDVCDSDWPWAKARINGNGIMTSFSWGY